MKFLIGIILVSLFSCINNGPNLSTNNIKSITIITVDSNSYKNIDSSQVTAGEDIHNLVEKINSGKKDPIMIFLSRYLLYLNYSDGNSIEIQINGKGSGAIVVKNGCYDENNLKDFIESLKSHYGGHPPKIQRY